MTRPASRRKAQSMPTPLTRTSGPFNITNNALDGYETNCTDRWRYIKIPLQSRRRYLKEKLTPQRLEPKARYIKPSTLPWKGTKNINLKKRETIEHSWLFHIYSIILFWLWYWRGCGRHHTSHHPQQKKFPWSYRYPSRILDPSGYALLDWRSYASSLLLSKQPQFDSK